MKLAFLIATLSAFSLMTLASPTGSIPSIGRDEVKVPDGTLGSFCGGIVGFPCNEGLVCQLDDKNIADSGGVCIKKPKCL
ncbi:hypothetical protein RSOLAG1IB_07217 [Rhizoctonia solani AG-1 IB]|uniref:Uncharacterized protein n=1 Tax=Thanatephorus cucumeris (strain AG1-IB / isolate 7/3/14) TaxID=1108050 RepID=A0A0B7FER4_THACB|nr:hypothetical protein RSOLAG1IB_07217 [Rhizoctonia solani AG-1 IB]